MKSLLSWDIYEITNDRDSLIGIKLRGSLRKYAIEQGINLLAENAEDITNVVRFAVLSKDDGDRVILFVRDKLPTATVTACMHSVQNPVLSKLKVNDQTRY